MQLLESKRFRLPTVYLVETDKDLLKIPLGIPFIKGSKKDYNKYVKLFEFKILLDAALRTKLPFNWLKILSDNGYRNLYETIAFSEKCIYSTKTDKVTIEDNVTQISPDISIQDFIEDISYQVDIEVLKDLKVIPTWFSETIEEAVKSNILNSITWNPGFYNKKLGDVSGSITINNQNKNLIIIDISNSIPKSIAKAVLLLSKTMVHNFYADLIITGRRSEIFNYEEVENLDIDELYSKYGNSQECKDFRAILSRHKSYDNVIVFGDNHTPLDTWEGETVLSFKQAYDVCNFKVNKIISFHTTERNKLAGYAEMFSCKNIEYIENWVHYLNK